MIEGSYIKDERTSGTDNPSAAVGLIAGADQTRIELHGFEVTLDDRVVVPELRPNTQGDSTIRQTDAPAQDSSSDQAA